MVWLLAELPEETVTLFELSKLSSDNRAVTRRAARELVEAGYATESRELVKSRLQIVVRLKESAAGEQREPKTKQENMDISKIVDDHTISRDAVGVADFLSKREGGAETVDRLCHASSDDEISTKRIIEELVQAGYATRSEKLINGTHQAVITLAL